MTDCRLYFSIIYILLSSAKNKNVFYFYRFNPKMYLNKIPPSVERDGMFYISRKEIELIKEILNSRDKIVINGLHFFVDSFKSSCNIFYNEDYDGEDDDC